MSAGKATTPGIAMNSIMPTSMAIHISAKWRTKRPAVSTPARICDGNFLVVRREEKMYDMHQSVTCRHSPAIQQVADHCSTSGGMSELQVSTPRGVRSNKWWSGLAGALTPHLHLHSVVRAWSSRGSLGE